MDFYCPEKGCSAPSDEPVLRLPDEACMDERNLAAVFCPRCGQTLVPKRSGSNA